MIAFRAALDRLDALIARELQRMRARYELSLDELRGLYVSDAMADALLQPDTGSSETSVPADLLAPFAEACAATLPAVPLTPLGCGMLVLALAPECDAKYGALYGYLNDNLARRWPSADLAARLLCPDEAAGRQTLRALLSPTFAAADGGLVASGLIELLADEGLPELMRGWRPARTLVHHALGLPGHPVAGLREIAMPPPMPLIMDRDPALLVVAAAGLDGLGPAALWATRSGRGLMLLEKNGGDVDGARIAEAALAARLNRSMLAIEAARPDPAIAAALPADQSAVILAPAAEGWDARLAPRLVMHRAIAPPDSDTAAAVWRLSLQTEGFVCPEHIARTVAERYVLPASAIARAARRAALAAEGGVIDAPALLHAASAENAADLAGIARPVTTQATWDDLVLPSGTMTQLKDFAAAVASRGQVFDGWGFAKVGRGGSRGLAALFSGGSGTGKTMSAAVIGAGLGLELWRIDLSATVSKYIGETEKNLDRIFSAAGAANAILFFDEADALFGKRSEVKDSHDRYANVEVAYLLQRLEDHPGIVILATNLSRNLDGAFLRRLPFVVEFPLPDAGARAAIWRKAIPAQAPLAPDVDLAALAERFELAGGDIRTAALEAAFLAAAKGGAIDAEAFETAVHRQLMKRGQVPPARMNRRANGHANGLLNGAAVGA